MGNFAKYWIIWVSGALLAQQVRTRTIFYGAAGVPFGFKHFLWRGIYFLVMLWGLNHPAPLRRIPTSLGRCELFLGDIS